MHRYRSIIQALILSALSVTSTFGQSKGNERDVESIDAIVKAYYEVVSGPAGQPRDWARDRSLHHPDAQIAIVRNDSAGGATVNVMTLSDFHRQSAGLEKTGFFESEIHRQTSIHGAVANVWSTYEWKINADGPVGGRGVNSIQLAYNGRRWWILGWMFDGRTNAPAVPKEYLPD